MWGSAVCRTCNCTLGEGRATTQGQYGIFAIRKILCEARPCPSGINSLSGMYATLRSRTPRRAGKHGMLKHQRLKIVFLARRDKQLNDNMRFEAGLSGAARP